MTFKSRTLTTCFRRLFTRGRRVGHRGQQQISDESPLINVSAHDKVLLYASACLRSSHCNQNHFWGRRTGQLPLARKREKKRSKSTKTAALPDSGGTERTVFIIIVVITTILFVKAPLRATSEDASALLIGSFRVYRGNVSDVADRVTQGS